MTKQKRRSYGFRLAGNTGRRKFDPEGKHAGAPRVVCQCEGGPIPYDGDCLKCGRPLR